MKINLDLSFCLRLLFTVSLTLFTNCSNKDAATAFLDKSPLSDSQGDKLEGDKLPGSSGSVASEDLPDLPPPGSVASEDLPDLPPPGSVASEDLPDLPPPGSVASEDLPNVQSDDPQATPSSRENKSFLADGFLDQLKDLHFQKYSEILPTNLDNPITSSDITSEHLKPYFSVNETSEDDEGNAGSYDVYKAKMNSLLKRENLDHGYLKEYFAQAGEGSSKYDTCYANATFFPFSGEPYKTECNVYNEVFDDSLETHWKQNKEDQKITAKINQYKTCYSSSSDRFACDLFDDETLNSFWNQYNSQYNSSGSSIAAPFDGWEIYEFDQQDVRCYGDPDGFYTGGGFVASQAFKLASKKIGYEIITNEGVGDNTFRVMVRKAQDADGTLLFLGGGGGCVAAHDDPRPAQMFLGKGMQACMREASIGGPFLFC